MDDAPHSANIAATIFVDLRRQILAGVLCAGQRLPGERELAAKYGTNRNTLREAVRKLEQARLVSVRHGQGVTVTDFRRFGTLELLSPLLETRPDPAEIARILADLLPARLMVLEFASRIAVRRADANDIQRLRDITELLISAFDGGDPQVMAHGFQTWLDALIDAGHSLAERWIANPLLDAYRELLDRMPYLWVMDPAFVRHLRALVQALEDRDEEAASSATRDYYSEIDAKLLALLAGPLGGGATVTPSPRQSESANRGMT
ncbi:MAG: FadR family transcriptional regulator [Polyangiaceae bacterium]|nr:FadR family transcriptional regulator [Polyangiaceae bacterium]